MAAVGPRAAIETPEGAELVELGEAALLPGLVNVHAHPELSLFRGALEDLRFRGVPRAAFEKWCDELGADTLKGTPRRWQEAFLLVFALTQRSWFETDFSATSMGSICQLLI